jgi:pimeloyl-ACP methyl ester carboxylesterase
MSNWVSEDLSQRIHVYSGGDGSTVVLVPGWPATAEAYSELFPLLEQDHSILSVDPPGLGDSAPSDLLAGRLLDFFMSLEGSAR